jgi:hypothetical protein
VSILLRTALGAALVAACLALAIFCALHGVLFGTLLALFTAGLFAWAVYDNRRIVRARRDTNSQ